MIITLFSPVPTVDSSSTRGRRTRPGPDIVTIMLYSLICTTGLLLVYLILANFKYQSLSKSLSNKQDHEASVMSTSTTDASFLLALIHLMDSGMGDLDYAAAGFLLFVCFVALMTIYFANQLASCIGFFDWCWSLLPTKRSVTDNSSSTVAIELGVDNYSDDDDEDNDDDAHDDNADDDDDDDDDDAHDDDVHDDDDYDDDDDDDDVEEMDWEPTPDATFYHFNDNNCIQVKSKSRIWYVPRRSSHPLYWRHPLLLLKEYHAASQIKSPGRSFVKAGRALATIPEGVHFLEEVVSTTHIVPRDGPHEIARGRRITDSDIDSRSRFFLSAGRAFIHFFTELASNLPVQVLMVVRRDGPTESDYFEIDDDGIEEVGPPLACREDDREVLVHEDEDDDDDDNRDSGIACDDYDQEDPFVHDGDDNNDDHDDTATGCGDDYNQQEVISAHNDDDHHDDAGTGSEDYDQQEKVRFVVPDDSNGDHDDNDHDDNDHVDNGTSCDDQAREVLTGRHAGDCDNTGSQATFNDNEKKESDDVSSNHGVLHVVAIVECDVPERTGSMCCAEDLTMRQVVQALPLRRSNRLAERRQHQQSHIHTNNGTTTTCGDTELSTPDLLGSTFVNGRRRSSRHLAIRSEDATIIPCSGRSRRSRCSC